MYEKCDPSNAVFMVVEFEVTGGNNVSIDLDVGAFNANLEEPRTVRGAVGAGYQRYVGYQHVVQGISRRHSENGLEAQLYDELGYIKYDYRSKDTDNSHNGHSSKTLKFSFGEVDIDVSCNRKGEFEPQLVKKTVNIAIFRFPFVNLFLLRLAITKNPPMI